jgi:glycine cleavage system H protein
MKAFEFDFPEDRYYLKNHIWLKPEKGDMLIAYETIKAVSQITLPFDAKVMEVNEKLWDDPNMINSDPYGEWLVKIEGEWNEKSLLNVRDAADYYKKLIAKERERYAGN